MTAIVNSISRTFAINGPPKADEVVQVGLTLAEAIASLVTLLALVFFWLTEHARLQRYALAFVSLDRRAGMREAWDEVENRLGLWVRGQLILMGSMASRPERSTPCSASPRHCSWASSPGSPRRSRSSAR